MLNTAIGLAVKPPVNEYCDSCPARALVAVELLGGRLTFCGHHADHYSESLNKQALGIVDLRVGQEGLK